MTEAASARPPDPCRQRPSPRATSNALRGLLELHFARPVTGGELRAVGRELHGSGRLFLAEAELLDSGGQLLARGSGLVTRSAIALDPSIGYV